MRGEGRDRVGMKGIKREVGMGDWGVDPLSSLRHAGYRVSRMGSHRGPGLRNDRQWHVLKQDWALSGKAETGRAATRLLQNPGQVRVGPNRLGSEW